jgi:hypothetical protein
MSYPVKYWCNIPVSIPWRSSGNFRDIQIWLLDNVPNHSNYEYAGMDYTRPSKDKRVYYFAHEEDAAMFALRWS